MQTLGIYMQYIVQQYSSTVQVGIAPQSKSIIDGNNMVII